MPRLTRAAIVMFLFAAATFTSTAGAMTDNARIIGGAKPAADIYASHLASTVALISMDAATQYDGQFCGGMLIDELHVLTAAHCVVENDPVNFRSAPSSLRVLAGTPKLNERSLAADQLVPVSTIFVNPYFNLDTFRFDAAILRLSRPITGVPILSLMNDADAATLGIGTAEVPARAAGWGDTDTSSDSCCFPADLLSITMSIHTDATCTSNLQDSPTWRFDPAHQVCSGAVGRDTCQGDSGGPLIVDVAGVPKLAGVVSHGVGCGEGFYGIYARSTAIQGWVASIPGTTEGDTRDVTHGPDDSIAPTVSSASIVDYSSVRLTMAGNGGPAFTGYTAWLRAGAAASAEDIFLGRFTTSTFKVNLPPRNSSANYRVLVRGLTANGESPAGIVNTGPRIDRVRPGMPRSTSASVDGNRLLLTWLSGIDRQSGVEGHEVQRTNARGAWGAIKLVESPTRRFVARIGDGSGKVRIRTRDWAGNVSAWDTWAY